MSPPALFRAIEESVRSHLVSDVPVGAFLSGGLDSSAIVRIMRDATGDRLKTFSVGFDDGSYDERPFARLVAGSLGTEHHEVVCTPRDFAALWPETVWHADGLAADISNIPLFMLARAAFEHLVNPNKHETITGSMVHAAASKLRPVLDHFIVSKPLGPGIMSTVILHEDRCPPSFWRSTRSFSSEAYEYAVSDDAVQPPVCQA